MEIFTFNRQQHPDENSGPTWDWPACYTALNDKKNAIANWEIVLHNVPPNMANRTAGFEATLKKLKEST